MRKIRSAYDDDGDKVSNETGLLCSDKSLAKQSEAQSCDVNVIVQRWLKSGGVMDLSQRVGQFLDVADVPDYHTSLNFVRNAEAMFLALPVSVRERFDNDPGRFLDFAQNPDNLPEMVAMGLGKAPVEPVGSSGSPLTGEAGAPTPAASVPPSEGV